MAEKEKENEIEHRHQTRQGAYPSMGGLGRPQLPKIGAKKAKGIQLQTAWPPVAPDLNQASGLAGAPRPDPRIGWRSALAMVRPFGKSSIRLCIVSPTFVHIWSQ